MMQFTKNYSGWYNAKYVKKVSVKAAILHAQSKGMKKDIPHRWKTKERRGSYTLSNKIVFKQKITRDKDGYSIMIK